MTDDEPAGRAHPADITDITDIADEAITAGGSTPPSGLTGLGSDEGRRLVDSEHRAEMATGSEPNGWFAGPHADPDRFELLGSGLAGGEGNTWRGRYRGELTAPLTLAVKELRRPPHAAPDWPAPADLRRWNDQRALLQYMRIDHLVTVIDIFVGPAPHLSGMAGGAAADTPYVVMEWVPGPTLADELSGRPADRAGLDERLAHVQHVAEALHSLHSRTASAGNPSLHRDVKPTNCILDPRRGVVLVDVGTMRRMDDGYDHDGFHTPAYTAPEVLANPQAPRAAASDLYSLGALAYFCVVGEDPPVADQPEAGRQISARLLAAARNAQVKDVDGFVEQLRLMLDPQPHQRPGDAMSWSRRLRTLAAVRRPRRALLTSRQLRVATSSAVVAVAAVISTLAAVWFAQDRAAEDRAADRSTHRSGSGLPPGTALSGGPGGPGGPGGHRGPGAVAGPLPLITPSSQDGTVHSDLVTITNPPPGRPAPLCTVVRGTSKLPAGQTLVTSVVNLTVGDEVAHLQEVNGWLEPAGLGQWEGVQFIGLPNEPPGSRFRVEVVMVPLAALQGQGSGPDRNPWRAGLPTQSRVVASVLVTRSAEDGVENCPGGVLPGPPPGQ
jgi:serine/threonine-protein kinase